MTYDAVYHTEEPDERELAEFYEYVRLQEALAIVRGEVQASARTRADVEAWLYE